MRERRPYWYAETVYSNARMCIQEADIECASWLADAQVPFSLVFTKTDKRKKGVPKPQQNMEAFQVTEGFYKLFWHHLFPL